MANKLAKYILEHSMRGDCECGRCIDSPLEVSQPTGHTANVIFFKVKNINATKKEFLNLVQEEYPEWLDGKEHNYITMGAEIGDQGIALMAIGLGTLLGVWNLLTPITLGFPPEMAMSIAGSGMIAIFYDERN